MCLMFILDEGALHISKVCIVVGFCAIFVKN